ncbi:MAG: hypothetical protein FWD28_00975 [Treponema sp.]|nr:hypothetical protein [Treponema sp.]
MAINIQNGKNFVKSLGIIIFAVVIVFSFSSCRKDLLDRTSWMGYFQDVKIIIRFNNPNFSISTGGHTFIEGSYSISGMTVSMSETVSSETMDNAFFIGTISGDILSIIIGNETINFTKRHSIFN